MIFTSSQWSSFLKRFIHDVIMNSFIFFLCKFCLAAWKERESNSEMIYKKIEYLMVNSWNECSQIDFELTNMKHLKVWEGMGKFKFGAQLIHEWQVHGRTKVARSQIAFDTTKGHTVELGDS
jgi:hypothetical protein